MHLYLHIPFCKQACHYCDFHFSTSLAQKSAMVAAICHEIELRKDYLPSCRLETIYFGGGTPSLLSEKELSQIFETIHRFFSVESTAEITMEANPDDLSDANLHTIKQFANRLSIGIQSFDNGFLTFMNRAHNSMEAEICVKKSQDAGFQNISVDLIYGSSHNDIFYEDLEKIIALYVPHISTYSLTIEPKTVLGNWLKKGKINPIDDDIAAHQLETLMQKLGAEGYEQYEISNFARNGFYSKHNSAYWKRRPYLGVGPSAHSYNGVSREYNVASNAKYLKPLPPAPSPVGRGSNDDTNSPPYWGGAGGGAEILTPNDQANDYLLTSLRTIWGCELSILNEILGIDFAQKQRKIIAQYTESQQLIVQENTLFLTKKGKLWADRIASDLFLV